MNSNQSSSKSNLHSLIGLKNRRFFWWFGILCVVVFRFYLTSHDPIVPLATDSRNYALQAEHYLTDSSFARLPKQSPGLSIVAKCSNQLGIPFKIFLDSMLIGAAFVACLLLQRVTRSFICSWLAFVILALNPWFYLNAKRLMSEPLTGVILLCLVLSAFPFLYLPIKRWRLSMAIVAGLISTLYILTRSEMPLLLSFWFLVCVAAIFRHRVRLFRTPRTNQAWKTSFVLIPFLFTFCSIEVIKSVHERQYGVRALTQTEAPGFKALIDALYSIPPEEEIRFAPVTRQSIAAACDVSPTLNEYRERFLDTNAPAYRSGKNALGLEDEFGTWLNWHLIRAFRGVNQEKNQLMHQAADEIRAAQAQGQIGKRFGKYPIDPLWRQWMPGLVPKTGERLYRSIHPVIFDPSTSEYFVNKRARNLVEIDYFDNGLLRRKGVSMEPTIRIYGYSNNSRFRRVRLYSSIQPNNEKIIADTRIKPGETGQTEFGFVLPKIISKKKLNMPTHLEFYRHYDESVPPVRIKLPSDVLNRRYPIKTKPGNREYWHVSTSFHDNQHPTRRSINVTIQKFHPWALWGSIAIAFLLGLTRGCSRKRLRSSIFFILVAVGFVLLRSVFYALVEVWLNWGDFRYVEPNSLFMIVIMLTTAFAIGCTINRRIPLLRQNRKSVASS